MPTIYVRQRVRPIRFAFLVHDGNAHELRQVIQVNTVLWGGMFNSIIPVFRRTPKAWSTKKKPAEIVAGYLDAFDPDVVVAADGIDATAYGVPKVMTAPLGPMLTAEGLARQGMDVMDAYRWRYEREFQFVQRHPARLRLARSTEQAMELFAAAVFGEYPESPLGHFRKAFDDLGGEVVDLAPERYPKLLNGGLWPLRLGESGLEDHRTTGPRGAFLLVDPTHPGDLVDFWNLRAMGWHVAPIPVAWAQELLPRISDTIRKLHRPDKYLRPWVTRACMLKGRSVSNDTLARFIEGIEADTGTYVVQTWLPRPWEAAELREADRLTRVELSAGHEEQKTEVHDDKFTFNALFPPFGRRWWAADAPTVANVIELQSYDYHRIARLIPRSLPDLDEMLRWVGRANRIRGSSEGVVLLASRWNESVTWHVPHGLRVMRDWLRPQGRLELSGAGKMADHLIQIVGGPNGVRLIHDVQIVTLFGRASEAASRDIPHSKLLEVLRRLHGNHNDVVDRRVKALVDRAVLRFGMRLQCEQCSQQNWFALDELRDQLTCQWCLESLPFPTARPPKTPCWSYRPLGPFAAKGHAQGAYVVAAAIRLLNELAMHGRTTWLPSFTLESKDSKLEADFGMLWNANGGEGSKDQFILGECKTFNRFEAKDYRRMKNLAEPFPGAVIVFATFNPSLLPTEKKSIRRLATWGRKGWRSPVLLLTARELTSDSPPPYCWHGTGDAREAAMYDQVTKAPYPHVSLRRLADTTQQLYLDMEADPDWPHIGKP
jgi:hypothetical protein